MSDETTNPPVANASEPPVTDEAVANTTESTQEKQPEVSEATTAEPGTATADTADDRAELLEKIAALEAAQVSLSKVIEERNAQYMRLAADFENFRKRTQREKEELELQVKCKTISELLPVVDSFELARTHIQTDTEAEEKIHRSYQGVYKQLVECLKRIGVSPMRTEGKPFDPNHHEAVIREPTADHPEGTVIEELKRGYMLGDRVLRHAMVKVAAPPEENSSCETPPANDVTDA